MATRRRVTLTRPVRGSSTTSALCGPENNPENKQPQKTYLPSTPSIEGGGKVGYFLGEGGNELNVEALYALATKLPLTDRKRLLAMLALDSQTQTGEGRDLDMWNGCVHSALVSAIGTSEASGVGLLPLRRMLGASASWAPVQELMRAGGMDKLSVTRRQSVYMLLANILLDHARDVARRTSAPLSGRLVANCAQSIAAIFDAAFPGYLRAGLAPLVAAQLTRPREAS